MSLKTDIDNIKNLEQGITNNKVSKFAYTDTAYTNNDVNGVQTYNINNEQNIPVADADVLQVNTTIVNKGYRAQASSLTRMLVNHFFGRVSYNLNKINDFFLSFLTSFSSYLGQPNGVATLDENGRIPYSQLPESAVEYKGEWNASTNTPTLVDGTGTNGSMYYVSVGGTQNLGSGNITFLEGDRIIYNGEDEVWQRLSGGTVKSVNSVSPDSTGNVQLSFSNLDGTVANSQIADKAVTNAKIDDNAVTNAKIADNAVTNVKFGDVLPISKGGTGANNIDALNDVLTDVVYNTDNAFFDTDLLVTKHTESSGLKSLYAKSIGNLWTYIQNKISSVLGLTSAQYNGNSQTTKAIKVYDLDDGTDLDYVRNPGQYKIDSGTVTNAPDDITNGFNLEVFYVKSTYVCQRLTRYVTTGVTFVYVRTLRYTNENMWTEWRRLAYTDSTVANANALTYTGTGTSRVTAQQTDRAFFGSPAVQASYLIFNHGKGDTYYHQMIRMPFGLNGSLIPQYQRMVDGSLSGWKDFITSENIASQSVANATTAENATHATNDGNGDNIANTYETKANASSTYATKTEVSDTYATKTEVADTYEVLEECLKVLNLGTANITPPPYALTESCYKIFSSNLTIYKFFFKVKATYGGGSTTFYFNHIPMTSRLSFLYGEISIQDIVPDDKHPSFISYEQNLPSGSYIYKSKVKLYVPALTTSNVVGVTLYFNKY